jgi:hypothetical protein
MIRLEEASNSDGGKTRMSRKIMRNLPTGSRSLEPAVQGTQPPEFALSSYCCISFYTIQTAQVGEGFC